jgi:metal-responsive CopG/Arc/MetJ family transcriptional regulator
MEVMSMATVNVSFPSSLLKAMDTTARKESRSRSELLRAAVSLYLERKHHWERIFVFGQAQAKHLGLTSEDVEPMIAEYRKARRRQP